MAEPTEIQERQETPGTPAASLKAIAIYLLIALPVATVLFLFSADLLDSYHGRAACSRPLPRSDGEGDRVLRYVLVRPGQEDLELALPALAFEALGLPGCPRGIPPAKLPDDAPVVHKDAFTLSFSVGDRSWPTPGPADLVFPLLFLGLGLPLRNWAATGSPLRLSGWAPAPTVLRTRDYKPSTPRSSSGIGPPPGGRRKNRGRR